MKSGENMDEKGKRFADEDESVNEPETNEELSEAEASLKHDKKKDKDQRLKEKNSKKLEKLLKKQQKKEKHINREVLSYEDMPLEERENDEELSMKPRRKFKL